MLEAARTQGPAAVLVKIQETLKPIRAGGKREALQSQRNALLPEVQQVRARKGKLEERIHAADLSAVRRHLEQGLAALRARRVEQVQQQIASQYKPKAEEE